MNNEYKSICSCNREFNVKDGIYAKVLMFDNDIKNTRVYCSPKCLTRFGLKELLNDLSHSTCVILDVKTITVKERLKELGEIDIMKQLKTSDVHVMVDLETLGTGDDATVFQIGATSFNLESGKILSKFKLAGDIAKYKDIKIDGSTLKWWLDTNKNLLADIILNGSESEEELFAQFNYWLVKQSKKDNLSDVIVWGNGNMFDNVKIKYQINRLLKTGYPIFFKNDKDVRSVVYMAQLKLGLTEKELKELVPSNKVKHDALEDCIFQSNLMHMCYRVLVDCWTMEDIKEWNLSYEDQ